MYNLNNKIREYILVTSSTIDVTYNKLSMFYYQKDQVNHVKCNGVISYHIMQSFKNITLSIRIERNQRTKHCKTRIMTVNNLSVNSRNYYQFFFIECSFINAGFDLYVLVSIW